MDKMKKEEVLPPLFSRTCGTSLICCRLSLSILYSRGLCAIVSVLVLFYEILCYFFWSIFLLFFYPDSIVSLIGCSIFMLFKVNLRERDRIQCGYTLTSTATTPLVIMPSCSAAAYVRSIILPFLYGPLSTTVTITSLSLVRFFTRSFVPKGYVRWAQTSESLCKRIPLLVLAPVALFE